MPDGKKCRSCLLSERDARAMDRLLTSKHVKAPKQAAAAIDKPINEWTVRRALRRIGLISAVRKKKPALSEKNVKARLKFCKEHKNWIDDWKRVYGLMKRKIIAFNPMIRNSTDTVLIKG